MEGCTERLSQSCGTCTRLLKKLSSHGVEYCFLCTRKNSGVPERQLSCKYQSNSHVSLDSQLRQITFSGSAIAGNAVFSMFFASSGAHTVWLIKILKESIEHPKSKTNVRTVKLNNEKRCTGPHRPNGMRLIAWVDGCVSSYVSE